MSALSALATLTTVFTESVTTLTLSALVAPTLVFTEAVTTLALSALVALTAPTLVFTETLTLTEVLNYSLYEMSACIPAQNGISLDSRKRGIYIYIHIGRCRMKRSRILSFLFSNCAIRCIGRSDGNKKKKQPNTFFSLLQMRDTIYRTI